MGLRRDTREIELVFPDFSRLELFHQPHICVARPFLTARFACPGLPEQLSRVRMRLFSDVASFRDVFAYRRSAFSTAYFAENINFLLFIIEIIIILVFTMMIAISKIVRVDCGSLLRQK